MDSGVKGNVKSVGGDGGGRVCSHCNMSTRPSKLFLTARCMVHIMFSSIVLICLAAANLGRCLTFCWMARRRRRLSSPNTPEKIPRSPSDREDSLLERPGHVTIFISFSCARPLQQFVCFEPFIFERAQRSCLSRPIHACIQKALSVLM